MRFNALFLHTPSTAGAESRAVINISDVMMDSLIAMFPDVDPETLQAVLDSCNGNVEAAVEVLLGMTTERLVASSQRPPVAVARPIAGEEADDATRAWQMAHDEELAQQLGRQMAQDEELARHLQEQLIFEEEQQQRQLRSRLEAVARYPGAQPAPVSYPGAYPDGPGWASGGTPVPTQVARYGPVPAAVTEAGYHPNVHRPASWGVAAPPPPPAAGEEGYGIVSGLSSAGSSVVSAVGSLWSWATAAEPAAEPSAVLSASRSDGGARTPRHPGDGAEDEPREMQTIRSRELRGPARELVSVAGDEGTQDHSALYAAGGSGGSCSAAGGGDGSEAEVQVLTSGYAGGSGGEVRRRRGKVPQGDAEQHNDLL